MASRSTAAARCTMPTAWGLRIFATGSGPSLTRPATTTTAQRRCWKSWPLPERDLRRCRVGKAKRAHRHDSDAGMGTLRFAHPTVSSLNPSYSLPLFPAALPALHHLRLDAELVEQAADRVIDDVVDGLGPVVERRHDRRDDGTHVGQLRHGAQMAAVKRRFAHGEDEPAPLFEH